MKLFDVRTENQFEDLIWLEHQPKKKNKIILPNRPAVHLRGDFGSMSFQHFPAAEYAIWYSHYDVSEDRTFNACLDMSTIELNVLINNNVSYTLNHYGSVEANATQFNITYAPYFESVVHFDGLQEYTTFDVHFKRSYLEKMASLYPDVLGPFVEEIDKGHIVALYPTHLYATPLMLDSIRAILDELSHKDRDTVKVDLLVKVLFIDAISLKRRDSGGLDGINTQERRAIDYITTLILSDPSHVPTIPELARLAGMNTKKLKCLFKKLNGMSIHKFWQDFRLLRCREMLLDRQHSSLAEIALTFGYSDLSSFRKAFKKKYHESPSNFRKGARKTENLMIKLCDHEPNERHTSLRNDTDNR